MIDLLVVALAFGAIFVVELPDKTFIATLVMSTKMRPLLVWIGVGLAFLVQTGVAVGVGKAASFLPEQLIHTVAALMFVVGAIILFRAARSADTEESEQEDEYAARADAGAHGLRVVVTSFLVLFAAEWGDLSQLLTISLVAKYDDPVSVFIGAWGALLAVSGLAVIVGRLLLQRVRLSVLHYVGATVCVLMAVLTVWEMTR
ncbi:TMEM165/GDT1 family protein [Nocardioides sp. zg-1308]|uniref:GDT1 family protein n=1 Tax=Nocardioides renjunii TaxID=3095075 RepID=A0ABU5KAN9_9ACTN|nr:MULTISPECIES: TMEM165/GDT1 family protein [unclassified Nocardioides]MDZ5661495.1 TMEM165/GDT1 family protein [Nocardioides sp. S-58]NPD04602.1 TMEM165/GDT1 family protein [Nocardioides sp. zg-1308]WQQ22496.1 TMEM165/GDT1 family protein [Nocardioides sp. S-34]